MDKIVIASMAVEGGGETLFGRQVEGAWTFWRAGASMSIADDGDESWPGWSSPPVSELLEALPGDKEHRRLFLAQLYEVHPAFSDQLRGAYERDVGPSDWSEVWWEELLARHNDRHSRMKDAEPGAGTDDGK